MDIIKIEELKAAIEDLTSAVWALVGETEEATEQAKAEQANAETTPLTPEEKRKATYERKRQRREEEAQEREAIRKALVSVVTSEKATPGEINAAAQLLNEIEKHY